MNEVYVGTIPAHLFEFWHRYARPAYCKNDPLVLKLEFNLPEGKTAQDLQETLDAGKPLFFSIAGKLYRYETN